MSRRQPYSFDAPADGAKVFWKSLEEKSNPDGVQERAAAELAYRPTELVSLRKGSSADASSSAAVGRRGFLSLAGITAALFAEGCARRPVEKIFPYAKTPEHTVPGISSFYATTREHRGEAIGLLVESHEGRPTKIEGNPLHPVNVGATDAITQATIFDLYDPDRSRTPMVAPRGSAAPSEATYAEAEAQLGTIARQAQLDGGAKLHIVMEPTSSPTALRLLESLKLRLPKAHVHTWTSVSDAHALAGAKLAFGQAAHVVPELSNARVVLAVDADVLGTETHSLRATRGFAAGRRPKTPADPMSRLYVVEPSFTVTGMNADHRLRLAAQDAGRYLVALAGALAKQGLDLGVLGQANADAAAIPPAWLEEVAKDLLKNKGRSAVLVGSRQPSYVHAVGHAINAALGNFGQTLSLYPASEAGAADPAAGLKALSEALSKSEVGTLVVLGGNPVYDAPADLALGEKLRALTSFVHLGSRMDETSQHATLHIPLAHELEVWSDTRAVDGTVSIGQPLIAPLFGAMSAIEVLARFAGELPAKGHELVRATLRRTLPDDLTMSQLWARALQKGVVEGTTARPLAALEVKSVEVAAAASAAKPGPAPSSDALEVTFAPCPKLFDGRYANNMWLLELPCPVTKMSWDNAALISPATAKAMGLESGDVLRLSRDGAGSIDVGVWIMPGQADHSLGLTLGWGRPMAGRYGNKHGFDVHPLRTSTALGFAGGVKAQKLAVGELEAIKDRFRKPGMTAEDSFGPGRDGPNDVFDPVTKRYRFAQTQEHNSMEGRPVAIDATLDEYKRMPTFPQYPSKERGRGTGSPDPHVMPLWERQDYSKGHQWGMAFDLSACTGCNACVIACQAENNIPNVGKEHIARGREMSWIRVDRYFVGVDENNPQISFQPVACVQCEEAPCENVCPVNATEHSPDGLNDMAYNRCIGTRYCANNCPYKVRRFNFLGFHSNGGLYEDIPETQKMQFNPNVSVRFRGVMEKCTYCVQRIQEAKIGEKRTGKPIKDGDVKTACQQACPAGAIVFGDLNDESSRVAEQRTRDRAYRLLAELGTHPRTTYLGKIRNPNAAMGEGA